MGAERVLSGTQEELPAPAAARRRGTLSRGEQLRWRQPCVSRHPTLPDRAPDAAHTGSRSTLSLARAPVRAALLPREPLGCCSAPSASRSSPGPQQRHRPEQERLPEPVGDGARSPELGQAQGELSPRLPRVCWAQGGQGQPSALGGGGTKPGAEAAVPSALLSRGAPGARTRGESPRHRPGAGRWGALLRATKLLGPTAVGGHGRPWAARPELRPKGDAGCAAQGSGACSTARQFGISKEIPQLESQDCRSYA